MVLGRLSSLSDVIPPALGSGEVIQGSPVFWLSTSCRHEVAEVTGSGFTKLRALGEWKPACTPLASRVT